MEKLTEFFKANRGTQKRLAEYLGLQPSTVSQWKSIPPEYIPEVSDFTGIPKEDLIPEVFRAAREQTQAEAAE